MKQHCGIAREKSSPLLLDERRQLIAEHIKISAPNNRLACASAMAIARTLNVSANEVGIVADELRIKISNCQLRCF